MKSTTGTMRTMMVAALMLWLGMNGLYAQALQAITPGEVWPDDKGEHINAHGGNVMYHEGTYYWYGEAMSSSVDALWSVPRWCITR